MLNAKELTALPIGVHYDSKCLSLVVEKQASGIVRFWSYRFTDLKKKRVEMNLGLISALSAADARKLVAKYRRMLVDGEDPRFAQRIAKGGVKLFKEFADSQYPIWCEGYNDRELECWARSIEMVKPLHDMPLHLIEPEHVRDALLPYWTKKHVTAKRARNRLERIFDTAKVLKLRTGENPAAWRGCQKILLPRVKHQKAQRPTLDYRDIGKLITKLEYEAAPSARCVEFAILTATRSKEARGARWSEVDLDKATWSIPGGRMKKRKAHLVPLSRQAVALLRAMPKKGEYIFPSTHTPKHQPFFQDALIDILRRAGFDHISLHGMRSTFRNWAGEDVKGNWRREVIEHCLAHVVGDESERSYWTGEMIERRRVLLQAWADYAMPQAGQGANVVPLKRKAA